MPRKPTTLLLTTLAAATIAAVNAPTASAATYTPLKTASQGSLITRLLINDQTGEFHAQGRNLRPGDIVRLDIGDHFGHPSITVTANLAEPGLLTPPFRKSNTKFRACAGNPADSTRFICTDYHLHRN
jgi:hypothetical protein